MNLAHSAQSTSTFQLDSYISHSHATVPSACALIYIHSIYYNIYIAMKEAGWRYPDSDHPAALDSLTHRLQMQ